MSDKTITPDQMQALLKFASKKLGTTPEKLAETVQSGGGTASRRSPDLASKTLKNRRGLHDKARRQALLQTPEAQKLIEQILGKK